MIKSTWRKPSGASATGAAVPERAIRRASANGKFEVQANCLLIAWRPIATEKAMTLSEQVAVVVSANSALAGPLCFLAALLGSLLGTNLVVPGGAVLTAAGVLIGAGVLP